MEPRRLSKPQIVRSRSSIGIITGCLLFGKISKIWILPSVEQSVNSRDILLEFWEYSKKKLVLWCFYLCKRSTKLTIRWQRTFACVTCEFAVSAAILIIIIDNERTKMICKWRRLLYDSHAILFLVLLSNLIFETRAALHFSIVWQQDKKARL